MLVFDFLCMGGFVLAPPWLLLKLGIWFDLVSFGALLCRQWKWVSLENHQFKVLLQDSAMEGDQSDLKPLQSKKTCH